MYGFKKVKRKVSKYLPLNAAFLRHRIRKHVNVLSLRESFKSKPRKAHERFRKFNPALTLIKLNYWVKTRK